MLINVSTLLTEPVGHARRYRVEHEAVSVPGTGYERFINGEVRLIGSERGVIVMASLDLEPVDATCARCLETYAAPLHVEFDEEFVLPRDADTGAPIEADEDEFRIDGRRHLDLSEAVRQYEQSALPIQPLCRPDCRGLCPSCGQNLNQRTCACAAPANDHRWDALSTLAEQLRSEESDGGTEA